MPKKSQLLLPAQRRILATMGEQIKMARLRRRLPATLVAERAQISRATLSAVEAGAPSVSIGIYCSVLHALGGLEEDLLLVAKDDRLGRELQDMGIRVRQRAPRQAKKRGQQDE